MSTGSKNKEEQQPEKLGHKEIVDFLVIKSSVRNFLKTWEKDQSKHFLLELSYNS
jgi:hypothetical protein